MAGRCMDEEGVYTSLVYQGTLGVSPTSLLQPTATSLRVGLELYLGCDSEQFTTGEATLISCIDGWKV